MADADGFTWAPGFTTVRVGWSGAVGHIVLQRPAKSNAFDGPMWTEFPAAVALLQARGDIRAAVVSAAGRNFCAGLDLGYLAGTFAARRGAAGCPARAREALRRDIGAMQAAFTGLEACAFPVIAAVQGACVGAGVDLITAADLRYCTADASFSVKEVDLAITADLGTLQRLPSIVGHGVAAELALTARSVGGAEAARLGLVAGVFADHAALLAGVLALARELAAKSPLAVAGTKAVLLRARDAPGVAAGLQHVALWNSAFLLSDDMTELSARAPLAQSPPSNRGLCAVIVKLGGSAITDKGRLETLRGDTLAAAAAHVAALHRHLQQARRGGVCVVHGAGSFGHFQASEFGIARGGNDPQSAVAGFVATRRSVARLHAAVLDALIDAGVPAVGLSPCGVWTTNDRRVADAAAGVAAVSAVLCAGMVPVLHGDAVLDAVLGVTILSGDTLLRELALALAPEHAAFLTHEAGLFNRPPQQPGAALVPAVEVARDGSWRLPAGTGGGGGGGAAGVAMSTAAHDVSGGIAKKVAEAAAVAAAGCPVVIAQAGSPSGAAALLHGPAAFVGDGALRGTVIALAAGA
ncbi:DCI1 [Scenedesmus sp. PABB004]|nr:DCI1 [Scenedesmus sp. PABB004]